MRVGTLSPGALVLPRVFRVQHQGEALKDKAFALAAEGVRDTLEGGAVQHGQGARPPPEAAQIPWPSVMMWDGEKRM